jgi:hypothetical protein
MAAMKVAWPAGSLAKPFLTLDPSHAPGERTTLFRSIAGSGPARGLNVPAGD